jgi:Bacterial PH domain
MGHPGTVPAYRLWPEPDKEPGPLDDAYRQTRWVRPYRPGPYRVAVCLGIVVVLLFATMVSMIAAYGSASVLELGLRGVIAAIVYGGLVWAVFRAYLSGVWVTDESVRVVRPLSTRAWRWGDVADVRSVPGSTRLLGTPVRVDGHAVVLVLSDGSDVETPLSDRSGDFLGRSEAYDMAATAVEGWLEQHRRRGDGRRAA